MTNRPSVCRPPNDSSWCKLSLSRQGFIRVYNHNLGSSPRPKLRSAQCKVCVTSLWYNVQGFKKPQIVCKRGFFDKIFCEKKSPKSAPPSPQKMSFSSDLCHFKTTLAQFKKKSAQILIFALFFLCALLKFSAKS